jgi:hypothetical protein
MEQLTAMVVAISGLYNIPLSLVALIFVVLMMLAEEVGYRVGLLRRARLGEADGELGGGGVVLTSMFAILGLIIAFTYSSSVQRYEARKSAVIHEANALGTAYLRANLVAEPGRSELKTALYEYALTRVPQAYGQHNNDSVLLYSPQQQIDALQATLDAILPIWPITQRIVLSSPSPGPVEMSLVSAINQVLDVHTERLAALFDKLPNSVIWMLVVIAAAALSVTGYNAGVTGHISRWRMTIFACVLAGVMVVIIDFDRPGDGLIRVSRASVSIAIDDMAKDLGIQPEAPNSSPMRR